MTDGDDYDGPDMTYYLDLGEDPPLGPDDESLLVDKNGKCMSKTMYLPTGKRMSKICFSQEVRYALYAARVKWPVSESTVCLINCSICVLLFLNGAFFFILILDGLLG